VANSLALSGSVLRNWANTAAAIGFLVDLMTALVEPPQLPDCGVDASHCGSGAARHLPEVDFAEPERKTGPQAAVSQVAYLPLLSAANHGSVKSGSIPMTPSLASPPQYAASFLDGASLTWMAMVLLPDFT
jgi:hypothetical protein